MRDTLIAWYERLGYRRTGAVEPFPYGEDRYGEPRRGDLSLVVMEKRLGWALRAALDLLVRDGRLVTAALA